MIYYLFQALSFYTDAGISLPIAGISNGVPL
jgi:hypothetical protein